MSIEIELTQGKKAIIDNEDLEQVKKHKWHAHYKHGKWDAAAMVDYSTMTLDRFVLGCKYGDGQKVKHLNGNKLDCRKCNIEIEHKNQINRYNGIVEIDVGHGKVAIVDEQDYDIIKGYTWGAVKGQNSRIWYAQTNIKREDGKYTILMMHALIVPDVPKGMRRDHKNRNGLDNRQENIRVCSISQNARNQAGHRDAKHSKYKGVTRLMGKRRKCWVARIIVDYKQIYLGYFDDEIDAAKAYDEGAKKYFGEYARLNFPV